jgi:hypothetical protein
VTLSWWPNLFWLVASGLVGTFANLQDSEEKYHHVLHLFQTLKQEQVVVAASSCVSATVVRHTLLLLSSACQSHHLAGSSMQ